VYEVAEGETIGREEHHDELRERESHDTLLSVRSRAKKDQGGELTSGEAIICKWLRVIGPLLQRISRCTLDTDGREGFITRRKSQNGIVLRV
jgi:hypothetical protein